MKGADGHVKVASCEGQNSFETGGQTGQTRCERDADLESGHRVKWDSSAGARPGRTCVRAAPPADPRCLRSSVSDLTGQHQWTW